MVKSLRFFKKPPGGNGSGHGGLGDGKDLYKRSIYMQSKDSKWLNRNINSKQAEDDPEPIEEDIRD